MLRTLEAAATALCVGAVIGCAVVLGTVWWLG